LGTVSVTGRPSRRRTRLDVGVVIRRVFTWTRIVVPVAETTVAESLSVNSEPRGA
jgi:hypothetical protein